MINSPIRKIWLKLRSTLKAYRVSFISSLLTLIVVLTFKQLVLEFTTINIPIFSFHNVIDTNSLPERVSQKISDYTNTKQDLESFLDYLLSHNYWFLSSQELHDYFLTKSKPIPSKYLFKRPIMLTFDDGYKEAHANILPLLEFMKNKYSTDVKIVWFINPSSLEVSYNKNSLAHVTCNDLRDGLKKGFYDIQSHGFNHYDLTRLNMKYLNFELAEAQLALRRCTKGLDPNQTVASHIAYPYGASNTQVEKYVSKYYLSGYLIDNEVLQIINKLINLNEAPKVDKLILKYQISRLRIIRETSLKKMFQLAKSSSRLRKWKHLRFLASSES